MGIETTPWDAADHLDSIEAILGYLEAVFEDGDPELIAAAGTTSLALAASRRTLCRRKAISLR